MSSLSFFFFPCFVCWTCHVVWNVSLGSWSQIFQLCPFKPASCATQAPHWWGGLRSRKNVDSVQALLSSNEKLHVLLTVGSTNPKQNSIFPTMKKITYHRKPAQININQRYYYHRKIWFAMVSIDLIFDRF